MSIKETATNINLEFDSSFQNKVITLLYSDFKFLQQIYDILDPEYFESDGRKWIVNVIKKYYKTYKNLPSMDVFKGEYDKVENDLLKVNIKEKLSESWTVRASEDLPYIKDNFLEFCIHQNFKKAVYNSIDYIKTGNWAKIKKEFDDALKAGQPNDIGIDLLNDSVERILDKQARITIPSPWDVINDLMDGGFGKKELYIIIASAGSGKCVAEDTKIDIEYEEIGIEILGYTIWFKPWELIKLTDENGNEKLVPLWNIAEQISKNIK